MPVTRVKIKVTQVADNSLPNILTEETETLYVHPFYLQAILDAIKISSKKNQDYCAPSKEEVDSGGYDPLANFKGTVALGVDPTSGLLVRMGDKWMRICSYSKRRELAVENEGILDALLDMANYCFLLVALLRDSGREEESSQGGTERV